MPSPYFHGKASTKSRNQLKKRNYPYTPKNRVEVFQKSLSAILPMILLNLTSSFSQRHSISVILLVKTSQGRCCFSFCSFQLYMTAIFSPVNTAQWLPRKLKCPYCTSPSLSWTYDLYPTGRAHPMKPGYRGHAIQKPLTSSSFH